MIMLRLFDNVSEAGKHVSDDLIDLNKATSDALLENLKKEAGRLGHTFSESHQLFSDNSDAALFHFASDNNGSLAALVRVADCRYLSVDAQQAGPLCRRDLGLPYYQLQRCVRGPHAYHRGHQTRSRPRSRPTRGLA
jgi:hypothetical protein